MTLVDTNVIIDILSVGSEWHTWSLNALERRSADGPTIITDIIYAELSAGYASLSEVEIIVRDFDLVVAHLSRQALHLAGRAYARYRAAGGPRANLLPDFLIGAHASVMGLPILTRDARRYRSYFPDVEIIAPD